LAKQTHGRQLANVFVPDTRLGLAVACTIVFGVGLGSPGPMQFVLVAGVSSHLAAVTRPELIGSLKIRSARGRGTGIVVTVPVEG
jgi:hypothetical protein